MKASRSTEIARRSTDAQQLAPPPKRIKRPKNVIDEESYTEAISEIIARDFFPGLLETETQQEYLDALDSQDATWISSAGRRLQQVMASDRRRGRRGTSYTLPRNLETPRTFVGDTPVTADVEILATTRANKGPEIDTNMSLDKFQSLYTSEDNESFYKLLDTQNKKRAEKYAWMCSANNTIPSRMMIKQQEVEKKLLLSRSSLNDDGGERDRLAIRDISEKPARPDSWKSKPDNELMFAPNSIEDSMQTISQRAQADSRAEPKSVSYANTRINTSQVKNDGFEVPQSPSLSAVRNAIKGRRRAEDVESKFNGSETPRVNGYAFVDDEPEPFIPPPVIDFGKGELAKNPFLIKEQSKREDLHHRMVDQNAKTKRTSLKNGLTGKVTQSPTPRFPSSPRIGSGQLTPAAQRLWGQVGGRDGAGSPGAFGNSRALKVKSGLQKAWTPSAEAVKK